MRGWVLVAAITVALIATPMWAQRGGGGGHGGFGGGHGGASGGHASFAGHAGTVSSFHSSAGYRGWGGRGNGWGGRGNGWYGYPYRYYGRYRGYPYWGWNTSWGYGGWYYPWWGWGDFDNSSYDYPSEGEVAQNYVPAYGYPPPGGSVASYASQDEVQRIQDEVSQLRAQQEARRSQPQEPLIHADTVLVYRDGHTETVGNYAIAGNTLWIFNQSSAKKVPLSDLNLPATKSDNEQHGVDFVLPNSH
ncbi:MAG TPA: hypothetical protein VLV47_01335 [Candidatus Bathyarchaeia archaeon]|nr:hypothetical protein [Candidatus Bathyarchaeia archaeon]